MYLGLGVLCTGRPTPVGYLTRCRVPENGNGPRGLSPRAVSAGVCVRLEQAVVLEVVGLGVERARVGLARVGLAGLGCRLPRSRPCQ